MAERIAVIGTGTWGTTLAILLAEKGWSTTLWCRSAEEAERMASERRNGVRLAEIAFPAGLAVSASIAESVRPATIVLLVVPSQTVRANGRLIRRHMPPDALLLSCTKGIEIGTCLRMSEVLREELPEARERIAVLSGPNLAREIAAGKPASSVVAAEQMAVAIRLRDLLMAPRFRVYSNSDVIGVELAGALKNIVAIGAGLCDGLQMGDNAKAAFITRGLTEIARLGMAAGAQPLTFAGLAGLGDVIATCASTLSRNRYVGEQLARGGDLEHIQRNLGMVAEGVSTTIAARALGQRYGVEMPITEATYRVLFERQDPREAVRELMTREAKDEFAGLSSLRPFT